MYNTFSRSGFVIGMILVLLPDIVTGKGLFMSLLGHRLFDFLGKITFTIYLVFLLI